MSEPFPEHRVPPVPPGSDPSSSVPPPAPPSGQPVPSPAPPPAQSVPPPAPKVTYLPAPSGPHWGLVLTGLVFVVIAAGVVANQLSGFQVSDLTDTGPVVLVVGGLALALVGVVGMVARRRG